MKKIQLLIILPVVMAFLTLADYLVTRPELSLPANPTLNASAGESENSLSPPTVNSSAISTQINLTKTILDSHPELSTYILEKTTRSSELFETLDLGQMNIMTYKNNLPDPKGINDPVLVYEVQSASGKGAFTFLNLKLALTNQLSEQSEINADNQYGQASLFYNNASAPSTGFLLVQINDTIFGFQYPKNSPSSFQFVQNFIKSINTVNF